ncbi:MAG TPA: hypothetical protein VLA09_13715 [Longimicrobiales bacterium]|nr:hypothetical protein [Longimicrobiales bacterium]
MKRVALRAVLAATASALALALSARPLLSQVLHVNDQWEDCAIVVDPALTQAAWHQFVSEIGLVGYFRPLASARPLGPRSFEFAVLAWSTRIDDADPAWNDTFSHPDSTHWLFDGNALMVPGLMLRAGVTDRIDVGGFLTKNTASNYGLFGGQVQYSLLNDPVTNLAAASRLSFVRLFGPDDMTVGIYGLDFLVSKDFSRFSPYAGVSGYWSRGHETTSKVDLEDENVVGLQGTVGMAARIWLLRLGAELNLAKVSGYSFKVAFGS